MAARKQLLNTASALLTVLMLVFSYRYLSSLIGDTSMSTTDVDRLLLALSVAAFIGFYGLLSLHWVKACRLVDESASSNQYLAFFSSQPYKYLPTSLFTFSFRAVYAKKTGLSVKKSTAAQLFENSSMLFSNLVVFMLLYMTMAEILYGLGLLTIVILATAVCYRKEKVVLNVRGRKLSVNSRDYIHMLGISGSAWLLAGLSFVALSNAIGLNGTSWVALVAANTIAFLLGIIAFFAPGGIGVRELVYSAFSITGSLILAWRVLTFILDIILGLIAICVIYFGPNKKQSA